MFHFVVLLGTIVRVIFEVLMLVIFLFHTRTRLFELFSPYQNGSYNEFSRLEN